MSHEIKLSLKNLYKNNHFEMMSVKINFKQWCHFICHQNICHRSYSFKISQEKIKIKEYDLIPLDYRFKLLGFFRFFSYQMDILIFNNLSHSMVYYMEQIEEKSTISLEDDINIPPPPTMPAWATRELASLAECEVIYLVLFFSCQFV